MEYSTSQTPIGSQHILYNGTRKLPEIFSEEDIVKILNQLFKSSDYWKSGHYAEWGEFYRMRDVSLIATIYLLGLRPNEACSLKFDDFNMRQMTVHIRGENNKTKKDRVLPVPSALFAFYKQYFQFSRMRFWKGSVYMFPSFVNDHISPCTLKTIMREKVLKPLGLWEPPCKGKVSKFRLYTLRHSRASHILAKQIKENGKPDIFMIANMLGHADLRCSQVYLHTDKEYREYMRGVMN